MCLPQALRLAASMEGAVLTEAGEVLGEGTVAQAGRALLPARSARSQH